MARTRSVRCAILVALIVLGGSSTVAAYTIDWVPNDLNPGDSYHLVFVTSGTRNASSTDISVYNTFVNQQMDTTDDNDVTNPHGNITWYCIGSTASKDAEDNIFFSDATNIARPVYRLDGTRVADGSDDLWDGSIQAAISHTNQGTIISDPVWTGTHHLSGDGNSSRELGSVDSLTSNGLSDAVAGAWVFDGNDPTGSLYSFYGFSEQLTVPGGSGVPEPSTIALSLMGLAAGAALRRRRRRSAK